MFKLEFRTDNAAFQDNFRMAVRDALMYTAGRVRDDCKSGEIIDYNGNCIGSFTFTED